MSGTSFFDLGEYYSYILHQAEVFICVLIAYCVCPNESYKAKSMLTAIYLYMLYVLLTDWFIPFVNVWMHLAEITVFTFIVIFQTVKRYDMHSDEINPENVILLFYKPRNIFEFIVSLAGTSACSMSVVCGDDWYMFKRKKDSLQKIKLNKRLVKQKYTIVDTGIKITQDIRVSLDNAKGCKARCLKTLYFRFNCVNVFGDTLDQMGGKWVAKGLDFIPSIYLIKRMK